MKYLFLLFLSVFSVPLFSQVYFPKDTVEFKLNAGEQSEKTMVIQNNTLGLNLSYDYNIILDQFKGTPNWKVQFCDCDECKENYALSGSCKDLASSESWTFAVYINTNEIVEGKLFTIAFVNPNDANDSDTLTLKTVKGNALGLPNNTMKNKLSYKLSPNPASQKVVLGFNAIGTQTYTVSIVNILGKEILGFKFDSVEGSNSKTLNVESFEKGLYLVKLSDGKNSFIEKLVIN